MSGANKRLGKGATTAAHAASKKKSNAVNLTANTEANLRSALQVWTHFMLQNIHSIVYPDSASSPQTAAQGLDIAEPSQAAGQGTADAEEIASIYARLLAHGFQEVHVKEALQAQSLTTPLLVCTQPNQLNSALHGIHFLN